jgi:hypothetical protein
MITFDNKLKSIINSKEVFISIFDELLTSINDLT